MEDTCIVLAPPCKGCLCTDMVPLSLRSKYLSDYRHNIPDCDTGLITRVCLKQFPGEPGRGCDKNEVSFSPLDLEETAQKHPCQLLVVPYYEQQTEHEFTTMTPGLLTYLVEDSPNTGDYFTPYKTGSDRWIFDGNLGWVKRLEPDFKTCLDCGCYDRKLEACERHMFLAVPVNLNQIRTISQNSSLVYPTVNDGGYFLGMHFINEKLSNFVKELPKQSNLLPYPNRIVNKDGISELYNKLCRRRRHFIRKGKYPHHVILHSVFDRSLMRPTIDYNKYSPSSSPIDSAQECGTTSYNFKRPNMEISLLLDIKDQFHDVWYTAASCLGNLPSFKARFPLHIPLEMNNYQMYEYDCEKTFYLPRNEEYEGAIHSLASDMYLKNKNFLRPDTTICYALKPFLPSELQLDRSGPQFTLRKSSITLPTVLEGKEGPRASVLYDCARYMTIEETDTVWVGDIRFKPHETMLKDVSTWRETPLRKVDLVPGVYGLGATEVKEEAVLETKYCSRIQSWYDTRSTKSKKLPAPINKCNTCKRLWRQMGEIERARLADNTLHASLTLLDVVFSNQQQETKQPTSVDLQDKIKQESSSAELQSNKESPTTPSEQPNLNPENNYGTFWEHDVNTKRYFKHYVNMWACHEQEFKEISRMTLEDETDLLKPFNWWDNIDRDIYKHITGVSQEIVHWPLPVGVENSDSPPELDVRTARLLCATKLVIKNPQYFFERDLLTVDIAYGGRRGAVYSLVDIYSWEVCGMLLVDIRGRTTAVHDRDRNSKIIGLHFEPNTSKAYWRAVSRFATHLCQPHHTTSIQSINYNNFETESVEFVPECATLPIGRITHATSHCVNVCSVQTNTPQQTTVAFKVFGNLLPFDELWYSREDGTPYDTLTEH